MPSPRPGAASREVLARIERSAGELSTSAARRIEAEHAWYHDLSAQDRAWVRVVAQAGIASLIGWLRDGGGHLETEAVFDAAPRELTGSVSLSRTLDLVRTVVDVVETEVSALAEPADEQALRESVLRFSREIAFAAAEVYATAAESRGAWDARLEGLVVDAVLRGEADDDMQSRASALGWGSTSRVSVVVGGSPLGSAAGLLDAFHRTAARLGIEALGAVQGRRFVAVVGDTDDPLRAAADLSEHFADGPLVVGPTVPHLFAAGRSARAAISGYAAALARPHAPRPIRADDLLAERTVLGDHPAQARLLDRVWRPLVESGGGHLLETATAYLEGGGNLEATARRLYVHPNTVRYRLGRIEALTGYALTDPHDAFTVQVALLCGRVDRGVPLRRVVRGGPAEARSET